LHVVTDADVPRVRNVVVHSDVKANSAALLQLYADADLFVLPTLADCLGVVIEEAAATGLPVITTDVGGVGESVDPGVSGLLVPPGDARAVELAINALAEDPDRRWRMGQAAQVLAAAKFDAGRNNRAILNFMRELVEARASVAPVSSPPARR
jgi:glycosyltransferase involved in cell wall biosynthesis